MNIFYQTRIFAAYDPIMFDLWVWVDFGATWGGGPLSLMQELQFEFQLNSSMFRRIDGVMFGWTLFDCFVQKDTLHHVRKDTFQNIRIKLFKQTLTDQL